MKLYIFFILSLFLFISCEYNEVNFKGLDEMSLPSDVKLLEYTLTEADYSAISGYAVNKNIATEKGEEVATELANLKSSMRFSQTLPASLYVPEFLQAKWYSADNGSSVKVAFNQVESLPAYLNDFPNEISYVVSTADYQNVWSVEGVRYFSPAKSFDKYATAILSSQFADAEDGEIKIVEYNYSQQEPSGFVDPVATSIDENFESITANQKVNLDGWVNFAEKGDLYWEGKTYSGNSYPQFSAFGADGEAIAWLISPKVNLGNSENPKLKFDVNLGFYAGECLEVLISDDFNGDDPTEATWVDLTSQFAFFNVGGSYTNLYLAGAADLSSYKEAPVYVAFKYNGDKNAGTTTTYQIDNVKIGDNAIVSKISVFAENFSSDLDNWTSVNLRGDKAWKVSEYGGAKRVEMSAHNTEGEQDAWIVSNSISLPDDDVIHLSLKGVVGHKNAECLSVLVSNDYVDNVEDATWTDVTEQLNLPNQTSGFSPIVSFGSASLRHFKGENINIALRYSGEAPDKTTTYQIYGVEINQLTTPQLTGVGKLKSSNTTEVRYAIYSKNGSNWNVVNNAVILNEEDYNQLGFSYFGTNNPSLNYLPRFLSNKYPYAVDEDVKAVLYFSGSTTTLAVDEYIYDSDVWENNSGVVEVVEQFVKTNGVWVWDPSTVINLPPIRNDEYIMEYYQAATDWVWENIDKAELGVEEKGQGYVTSFGNNDYYTGCSAFYNNVDMRVGKAREQYPAGFEGLSDEEGLALMEERLAQVMGEVLSIMHPDAKPIDGVEVTYTVNMGLFYSAQISDITHSIVYKVVGDGKFEWVSGPTLIE